MAKYLFVYYAPMTANDAPPPDPAQMGAVMGEWNAWAAEVGSAMVDFGAPVNRGVRVTKNGTSPSTRQVSGYSILEAGDLDAALALTRNHPHLNLSGGYEVEVHEAQPLPGM
ncbi:YciI family protein [Angustibacter sp. McL0619]|uniref:YciI family protein n=1 Tax=Angustibacter sp. McL0619 TaxID=3415676 RepID=UPI003CF64A3C